MRTVLEALAMTASQVGQNLLYVALAVALVAVAIVSWRAGGKAYDAMKAAIRRWVSDRRWRKARETSPIMFKVPDDPETAEIVKKFAALMRRARPIGPTGTLGRLTINSAYRSAAMNREIARPRREGTEAPDWFPNPDTIEWPAPWSKPYDREQCEA